MNTISISRRKFAEFIMRGGGDVHWADTRQTNCRRSDVWSNSRMLSGQRRRGGQSSVDQRL